MTDPLETQHDAGVEMRDDVPRSTQAEHGIWHRPVVTRIPLARTLSIHGSNSDGHTGSI